MQFLSILLLIIAAVGHNSWMILNINWIHGHALDRRLQKAIRYACAASGLFGPLLIVYLYPGMLHSLEYWAELSPVILAYLGLCCVMSLVALPFQTIKRQLRPRPQSLVTSEGRIVDVSEAIHEVPLGRGRKKFQSMLPFNEVFQVEFINRTVKLTNLPAEWDGLTILHISDLHLCGSPDRSYFTYVMEQCAEEPPDIVALTGDILDSRGHYYWIIPILGRLRWNIAAYAVLGNHDVWYDTEIIRRRLERVGFEVLDNQWAICKHGNRELLAVGHEGPWDVPPPSINDCPTDLFRLCLSHTPDNIFWAARHRMDLMLAGHNHGGQIRIPGFGPILMPSRYSRRYDCGIFEEGPTVMHVSRGLGGTHPIRFNCPPEVTKLRLVRA